MNRISFCMSILGSLLGIFYVPAHCAADNKHHAYTQTASTANTSDNYYLESVRAALKGFNASLKKGPGLECHANAEFIFSVFNNRHKPWLRYDQIHKSIKNEQRYAYHAHECFTQSNYFALTWHLQRLSKKYDHAVIYINLYGAHALIIEKLPVEKNTHHLWRVYHAHAGLFSADQWLDTQPLKVHAAQGSDLAHRWQTLHAGFGRGRKLTTQNLGIFLMIIKQAFAGAKRNPTYIAAFEALSPQTITSIHEQTKNMGDLVHACQELHTASTSAKPLLYGAGIIAVSFSLLKKVMGK